PTQCATPLAVTFGTAPQHLESELTPPAPPPLRSSALEFGDGAVTRATGPLPEFVAHTYAAPGSYLALLTVTDTAGVASITGALVVVTVKPRAALTPNP